MAESTDADKDWAESLDFNEVPLTSAGKRIGVQWTPWMGDWFTSWSPRNSNNHAEGYWAHWVDLALRILQDPLTEHVRPDLRALVADVEPRNFYDETDRVLTYAELRARLEKEASA